MDEQKAQATQTVSAPYVASKLFKFVNLAICLVTVSIVFIIFQLKLLDKVELITLDIRYKLRGITKPSPQIVYVDMDESSISHIGRWPWSREWHASLITTLSEYKTKVIAFDIFFSEPSPLVDFFLIESTRLAKNVVYAIGFEFGNDAQEIPAEQLKLFDRFKLSETQIIGNKKDLPHLAKPLPLLTGLYEAAFDAGHVITIPDPDGTIRRAPAVIECRGNYYLHFGIETALAYLGIDHKNIKINLGKYIDLGQGTRIPIDNNGYMIINWAAPWGYGFKHYSYWEVVAAYQQKVKGEQPIIPLDEFKDKICLIGLTATGLIDIKPIPLQTAYPIVGLHANIINTILQKKFVYDVSPPINLSIILILTFLMAILVPRFRPLGGALATLIIILFYSAVSYLLFKFAGLFINIIYPLASVSIGFIAITIHSEVANALEKTRLFHLAVEDGLTKLYVVRHFKEILQQEMDKSKKSNKPLSLLISDIDHFKRFNDTYGHQAGDFVLREVANIFKSSCRQTDIAGRYGGEEFVILLPNTNRDAAIEFAERLRKSVEQITFEYNTIKLNVTISIGVAECRDDASIGDIIKRSDEALYVAKETGRNKVCFG